MKKIKVKFLLMIENSPYSGVVRPFINWYKESLRRRDIEIEIIGYKIKDTLLYNHLLQTCQNDNLRFFERFRDLKSYLESQDYHAIVVDDYLPRLKIVSKLKVRTPTIIYCQVLYGLHAISSLYHNVSFREKFMYKFVSNIPFKYLSNQYKSHFISTTFPIANSMTTKNLLKFLYDIDSFGLVYPPVDIQVFHRRMNSREEIVLLYLGSHAGDTSPVLIKKIVDVLATKKYKIFAFGNENVIKQVNLSDKVKYLERIDDKTLANVYSRSLITIAPQEWEQFGYVIAESVLCGTPVLALNYFGPREIIEMTKMGFLMNSKHQLIEFITNIEENLDNYYSSGVFLRIRYEDIPFTSSNSFNSLCSLIDDSLHKLY